MMPIDAISLDLDDTLWAFAPAQARAEAALLDWLLLHAPGASLVLHKAGALAHFRSESAAAHPEWAAKPDLIRRNSIQNVLLSSDGDLSLVNEAYEVFYAARQRVELFDDVLPALKCLGLKYPLIAVTNGNSSPWATGVGDFFSSLVTASDYSYAKPDARIFHTAAEVLGVRPHRLLHVGDNFHIDVVGAKNAGLQAAWVVRGDIASANTEQDGSIQADFVVGCLRELCAALNLAIPI